MKQSIKWHQECLANHKKSIDELDQKLDNLRRRAEKEHAEFNFAKYQLDEAIKAGKDGYDSELYKKKDKGKI
jgi:hypothetical protein